MSNALFVALWQCISNIIRSTEKGFHELKIRESFPYAQKSKQLILQLKI